MQNRIDILFKNKDRDILSVFVTAGFPREECTLPIIEQLDKAGVDMIEIGIPFSDPIADGPVIQKISQVAIENGMTLKKLFLDLSPLRTKTKMPILLMGYLNSVLQYGIEGFYKTCHESGIDGLILPDLSIDEYVSQHKPFSEKYNIHVVFLISPNTNPKRIKLIDKNSKGFIYLVSSNATTGTNNGISNNLEEKVKEIRSLNLQNPLIMGFGIKGNKEFTKACSLVNGAIVGSSFINLLAGSKKHEKDIPEFIQQIKNPKKEFQS